MFLLRETDRTVTDVCFAVGFTSLGTFSRTFRGIVGETPSAYRRGHGPIVAPTVSSSPRYALVAALGGQHSRAVLEKPPR